MGANPNRGVAVWVGTGFQMIRSPDAKWPIVGYGGNLSFNQETFALRTDLLKVLQWGLWIRVAAELLIDGNRVQKERKTMARFKLGQQAPLLKFKRCAGVWSVCSGAVGVLLSLCWGVAEEFARQDYYQSMVGALGSTSGTDRVDQAYMTAQATNAILLYLAVVALTICFISVLVYVLSKLAVAYKLSRVEEI